MTNVEALIWTNVEAIEVTLSELDSKGRSRPIDAAQIQMLRSMARALDQEPANAALWRQYRESLKELMADGAGDSGEDLDELFPPVGDSPPS